MFGQAYWSVSPPVAHRKTAGGIPIGFDARKVVATGTLPVIDIAMSHRMPGMGMIGMGVVSPPMQCFEQAVRALDAA